MSIDAVLLSRLQFFWVVALHILLPAFTVGLASYIAVLEGLHFFTGRSVYLRLSKFWLKVFAVSFGMGVVSGIVMPFQCGTNWSRFSDMTADIVGPLMAYEGLTAFFLEAGFLGVLLFGRARVPPWMHLGAAVMVAAGTLFSAFWILAVNSWMQTPVGHDIIDGRFVPADWIGVITWSSPFAVLTGVGLVFGYALIGACWLVMKSEGSLQAWARRNAIFLTFAVAAFIAMVSIWTPFLQPQIYRRWFGWPNLALLSPVPIVTLALFAWLLRSLKTGRESCALLRRARALRDVLSGPRDKHRPDDRSLHDHAVGGGVRREVARLHDPRHLVPAAAHRDVHRVVVLGLPGEGEGGRRLSLNLKLVTPESN